jgi:hypothetical protein
MDPRSRAAFLALIAAQAAHSIEEYVFRLYEVFPPARFLSGLVSRDLALGFAVLNASLLLLGAWCYLARVRPGHPSARAWAWFWTLLELGNGIGHAVLSLSRGSYFPGVGTAPVLLGVSSYLAIRLGAATQSTVSRTPRP